MLAVAKTPRIDLRIEGDIPERVLLVLREEYGNIDIVERRNDEEPANILEAALVEGENSGEPGPFDFDAFKARKRAEYERG